MARDPVLSGEIVDGGAIELLREIELRSLTGVLRFEGDVSGEILFYGGEIAVEQPTAEDGLDPVDSFLALTSGRYEVQQRLPPLPVSTGDDEHKRGSLTVHVPADLLRYCERAGLSGSLVLEHDGRTAQATYERGELIAIELDGQDADLDVVFAWDRGRFRITLDPDAPDRVRAAEEAEDAEEEEPPTREWKRPKGEATRQFLRVVELALADVTHQSEKARDPTRTSPPLPPPPKARPRPASIPPPARRRDDQTIRLIYLSGDAPPERRDLRTRHVAGDVESDFALPEARPDRRAPSPNPDSVEPSAMAKKSHKKKSNPPAKASSEEQAASSEEETRAPGSPDVEVASKASDSEASQPDTSDAGTSDAETSEEESASSAPSQGGEPLGDGPAKTASEPPPPSEETPAHPASAAGWVAVVLALGMGILSFMAILPPVSCPGSKENCGWFVGCANVSRDPENCGGCGQVCAAPNQCVYGECEAPEPAEPLDPGE